jgi:RNA polymerase sigma-70 factor (ECF subfamily)
MSGSLHDADDLLQESLLRAWRGLRAFEGRSSLRTWLYRVATHVCLDALDAVRARTLPEELGPPVASAALLGEPVLDPIWLEPCPEELYGEALASPEARYTEREAVALAFLVAIQLLPPKQRAVLILREVVGLEASECAEVLRFSVPAVKSALQRARETLASRAATMDEAAPALEDAATRALLARYVEAWELADVAGLVAVLHEDAVLTMPPYRAWLRGAAVIAEGRRTVCSARARTRMVATRANGLPAFAMYSGDGESEGGLTARGIHVIEVRGERIARITAFLGAPGVARFHLPSRLP